MSQSWYAIRVRSNFQQTTAMFLTSTGYKVFSPSYQERRQGCDRVRRVDVPLFPGYLFCHLDVEKRLPVLQTPGVMNIVGYGKEFVPVSDEEIEAVRVIAASPLARPLPYLTVGETVRIMRGPLAGVEGILLEMKNEYRLIVSVHLLQRSVGAEVSLEWVEPVKPRSGRTAGISLGSVESPASELSRVLRP
jgi:transcription antitermination factor NusG